MHCSSWRDHHLTEGCCDRGWQGGCHQVPTPPCLSVSQEFRLAAQGRRGRRSQPSVSCHIRPKQKKSICKSHIVKARHHMHLHSAVCACACVSGLTLTTAVWEQAGAVPQGIMCCWIKFLYNFYYLGSHGLTLGRERNTTSWIRGKNEGVHGVVYH